MQFHWSDSDLRGQDESCEALAPYVMALFDGEASEDQARRARTHLLLCQSCAHRWLDWNRSRDLLQSVPVPAPPPTLMWRVLMACRLAAFAKKTSSKNSVAAAPAKGNFSAEFGAPDALRAQILARTTRTAPTSTVIKSRRSFPILAMPTMAVPALALWLMVLQRDVFLVSQLPEPTNDESMMSGPLERDMAPTRSSVKPTRVSVFKKPVVRQPVLRVADGMAANETASEEAVRERRPRFEAERSVREERSENRSARVVLARTETDRPETDQRDKEPLPEARPVVAPAPAAPRPVAVTASPAVAPPRVRMAAFRPATLSDAGVTPRLRTARWEASTSRVARFIETSAKDPQPSRVAMPTSKASTPTPVVHLADSFEGEDTRVDEVRSVVDDFRAALAPDTGLDSDFDESSG